MRWILRFCVAWRMKARREQIHGKREEERREEKGEAPAIKWHSFFRASKRERGAKRSGPVYRYILRNR